LPQPHIGFFRALYLGDLLCAVPAARALRRGLPDARITLIGLPWASSFQQRFSTYFDDFLAFPVCSRLHEEPYDAEQMERFYGVAAERSFDVVLQLHGDGRLSNAIAERMAENIAGSYPPEEIAPTGGGFTPYGTGPEILRNLRVIEALGIDPAGTELEFPLSEDDAADLQGVLARQGISLDRYVCIHPGAKLRSRRWGVARFAAVADGLGARGYQVVLTGSAGEVGLTSAVSALMKHKAVSLAGQTSLGALAALIGGARLLVSNDTGVSHIAAALQTQSVIIANGSDVARWAPDDANRHRVIWRDVPCRPCGHDECPLGHPCALSITRADVMAEIDWLLTKSLEVSGARA